MSAKAPPGERSPLGHPLGLPSPQGSFPGNVKTYTMDVITRSQSSDRNRDRESQPCQSWGLFGSNFSGWREQAWIRVGLPMSWGQYTKGLDYRSYFPLCNRVFLLHLVKNFYCM